MNGLSGGEGLYMSKNIFWCFALIPYLVAYIAVRNAHWVIHTTSYSYLCNDNENWEPKIVSHGVRGGDYAVVSPLIFMPVTWFETATWYIIEPTGTPFPDYVGPPPQIPSSPCTQRLQNRRVTP